MPFNGRQALDDGTSPAEPPVYTLPDLKDAFELLDSYEFAKDELIARAKTAEAELEKVRLVLISALQRAETAEQRLADYDTLLRKLHSRVVKTLGSRV